MADGYFRVKKGFTVVQNNIARDERLSMKAKGLYLVIQSYITMPDKKWNKDDFRKFVNEGRSAFDSAWKELKETGYLKVYMIQNEGRGTTSEYELLDIPSEGPAVIYVKKETKSSESAENRDFDHGTENLYDGQKDVERDHHTENQYDGYQHDGFQGDGNHDDGFVHPIHKDLNNKTNNINIINSNQFNPKTNVKDELNPKCVLSFLDLLDEETEKRLKDDYSKNHNISEDLAYEPAKMKETIMYLSGWNSIVNDESRNDFNKESYRVIVENLVELATMLDAKNVKGRMMSYKSSIYHINEIINNDMADEEASLRFFIDMIIRKFKEALKETKVSNHKSYLKSMIVDNFSSYRLDQEATMQKNIKIENRMINYPWVDNI